MSKDWVKFAPNIKQLLDYESVDAHLLKHEVLNLRDFSSYQKSLKSSSLSNSDLVGMLIPKIFEKPRQFYRALRDHVRGNRDDVHAGNKELFDQLPQNFVSVTMQ